MISVNYRLKENGKPPHAIWLLFVHIALEEFLEHALSFSCPAKFLTYPVDISTGPLHCHMNLEALHHLMKLEFSSPISST